MSTKVTVKLGSFTFKHMEVPEHINYGGEQAIVVHKLVGGLRVVDAMGRDDAPIEWSGRFTRHDAVKRARTLDAMRVAGKPMTLTWGEKNVLVMIRSFKASYKFKRDIDYTIVLEVIKDNTAPTVEGSGSFFDALIDGDITDLDSLVGAIGDPALTGLYDKFTEVNDTIDNYASAGRSAIANIKQAAFGVKTQVNGLMMGYESAFHSLTAAPSDILGLIGVTNKMVAGTSAQATVGRATTNINQINSSSRKITVSNTTLYAVAASEYGNASNWTEIARANNLTDPKITGIVTLVIPKISNSSNGVLNA